MTRQIQIGDVSLPLNDYTVARTGILGITRSGKTYAAKGIAEQLIEHGVPVIVFDAIGVWRFLKTPGDGDHGKGFKVVVAGGEHPDLPLTAAGAPAIVRAAIHENIPLVIDLYDPRLSKADWRRIVQESFRILLYENKGLRHVFLEEAAEYAPQKIMDGQTYAEVEKLARMGGNKGIGITFINQRAQELNKAVLELCDNLVLLRQRGSHAIDALEKWLDRVSPDMAAEIAKSLPHMTQGDAWVWAEESENPRRTRTHTIKSLHPDRRKPDEVLTARKSVDTAVFVARLSGELGKLIEETKANDPAALRKEIAHLKRELENGKSQAPPSIEIKTVDKPVLKDGQLKRLENIVEKLGEIQRKADEHQTTLSEAWNNVKDAIAKINSGGTSVSPRMVMPRHQVIASSFQPPARQYAPPAGNGSNGDLPEGERKVMTVVAQYPDGATRKQVSVLAKYKRQTRDAYILRLRGKGYVDVQGDKIIPTPEGVAALGDGFEPLPTGDALRKHWMEKLPEGERRVFEQVVAAYPDPIDRETIGAQTEYKRQTRDAYILRLRAKQLVVDHSRGTVIASAELFQ